ncbi:MAG: alpha-L-rhamnosidase C-terminal domain-containing protein [Bacteroidota bacterium]
MWGIQPKTAGFGVANIKPQMGTLKHSKIELPTIKGTIEGAYQVINNRKQRYTIKLPANMVAEFEIVDAEEKEVKLNGQKVSLAFGVIRLLPGVNEIEISVNSF